jgi:hypothetical protein
MTHHRPRVTVGRLVGPAVWRPRRRSSTALLVITGLVPAMLALTDLRDGDATAWWWMAMYYLFFAAQVAGSQAICRALARRGVGPRTPWRVTLLRLAATLSCANLVLVFGWAVALAWPVVCAVALNRAARYRLIDALLTSATLTLLWGVIVFILLPTLATTGPAVGW